MRRVISILAVMLAVTATAETATRSDIAEGLAARAEAVQQRLNLTEQQKTQMESILEQSAARQQEVLKQYGIEPGQGKARQKLGLRKARQLGKDMAAVRKETRDEASKVLTPEQLAEFDKIQEERKAERRGKLRERRER